MCVTRYFFMDVVSFSILLINLSYVDSIYFDVYVYSILPNLITIVKHRMVL